MHALTQLRFVQRDLCVSDIYFLGSMDAHPGEFRQEQTGRRYEAQQSCTVKVVNGFVNGSVFGATMSGLSAMARATQLQIGFPAAARVVLGSTVAGGISFGVGLGLYRGVTCSLQHARGVDDIKNSMIAGGLIGALSEIPVFIRSKIITRADVQLGEQGMHVMRPRPRFLFTATTGSILCGVVYMMEAGMRSAPVQKARSRRRPHKGTITKAAMKVQNKSLIHGLHQTVQGSTVIGILVSQQVWKCWSRRLQSGRQSSNIAQCVLCISNKQMVFEMRFHRHVNLGWSMLIESQHVLLLIL